jgi:hypothetical protein
MTRIPAGHRFRGVLTPARVLVTCAGILALALGTAHAQIGNAIGCDFNYAARGEARPAFPRIPICAFPGAYNDSSLIKPNRCVGSFQGPRPDSVRQQARTITVRFLRDRAAEARLDFGGYRIYRVQNTPDTTQMVLIRRFSRQSGDERMWNFSDLDTLVTSTTPLAYKCHGQVVNDSVVTFVDPDSSGNYVKDCRRIDRFGRCLSRGDSAFRLVSPPGPHDGFRTWYAITYELKNATLDATYEEMFVPDTLDNYARCGTPGDPRSCPNLNNRLINLTPVPVEPTGGPTANLEQVSVVPNPFRAKEAWDQNQNELHFINLPAHATIKIYTVAGDLVTQLEHVDPVRDFARWDLKNQNGKDVASGIYVYRIEAGTFTFQNRFVVIR